MNIGNDYLPLNNTRIKKYLLYNLSRVTPVGRKKEIKTKLCDSKIELILSNETKRDNRVAIYRFNSLRELVDLLNDLELINEEERNLKEMRYLVIGSSLIINILGYVVKENSLYFTVPLTAAFFYAYYELFKETKNRVNDIINSIREKYISHYSASSK